MSEHNIRIIEFETVYPSPEMPIAKETDYVSFSAVGNAKYQVTRMRIVDAQRDLTGLWDVIKPHFEAWKKGEELPEHGTPLAAWNGCTAAMAKTLKSFDVRTVEDIADLTESQVQKIGLGGLYAVRQAAKRWVEAQGTRDIAAALGEKDAQIEQMQEQLAALMEMVQVRTPADEPMKRRPGRPRREDVAEEAA
jgi:hypothetical protein